MATSDDLPDAPWIVESWWSGPDPDCQETPYDICDDDDFLEGADQDFGWIILCWILDTDSEQVDECSWQDIWNDLTPKARLRICQGYQSVLRDDAADLYNTYWRRFRE